MTFDWPAEDELTGDWEHHHPVRIWRYQRNGRLHGFVCCFEWEDDSGRLITHTLPYTWQPASRTDGAWQWKAWEKPAPLYLPRGALARTRVRPVLVMPDEASADAASALLGTAFDVISWPGGSQAWSLAHWAWIEGRTVYLWPRAAEAREPLTRAERLAGRSPSSKPVLPEHQRPSHRAMLGLAKHLIAFQQCRVLLCPMPSGDSSHRWKPAAALARKERAPVEAYLRDATPMALKNGCLQPDARDFRRDDGRASRPLQPQAARLPMPKAPPVVDVFDPLRAWLTSLHWDGQPRLAGWLQRACLDPASLPEPALQQYLALVGKWFLMGMVNRAIERVHDRFGQVIGGAGSQFDYMLILEGQPGTGRSALLQTLAGPWFRDGPLRSDNRWNAPLLHGAWLFQIPGIDSLHRSDANKLKAFITSRADRFLGPNDRSPREHPRQAVLAAKADRETYFTDPTGNRRFWPVRLTRGVDIDWVASNRVQLFAEALVAVRGGERMYPSPAEDETLFAPQQQLRVVDGAFDAVIVRHLYGDHTGEGMGAQTIEIGPQELLEDIGMGELATSSDRYHVSRAAAVLRRLGWRRVRSSVPPRPYVYRRPSNDPLRGQTAAEDSHRQTHGTNPTDDHDGPPF